MKVIPSTYHQCIKFPGNNERIITLHGDQAAARDLLVAEVETKEHLAMSIRSPHRTK